MAQVDALILDELVEAAGGWCRRIIGVVCHG
jgi:hypothetical protein